MHTFNVSVCKHMQGQGVLHHQLLYKLAILRSVGARGVRHDRSTPWALGVWLAWVLNIQHELQDLWISSNCLARCATTSCQRFLCAPALFVLFLFMFVCCCSLPITYSTALQGRSGCNRSLFLGLRVASGWGMGYYRRLLSAHSGIHGAPWVTPHRSVHCSFSSMSIASATT